MRDGVERYRTDTAHIDNGYKVPCLQCAHTGALLDDAVQMQATGTGVAAGAAFSPSRTRACARLCDHIYDNFVTDTDMAKVSDSEQYMRAQWLEEGKVR